MEEGRLLIGDVPMRLYRPRGACRLLLLGHGGGHSKDAERFVRLSRHYAEQTGLSVVCIDAIDHGDRRPEAPTDGVPRSWHSQTSRRMVADWQSVVDHLSSIGPAVAYVGFSMGAVFGFPTVAAMPTITAAVFVAGGVPGGGWTDDPDLRTRLTSAAAGLGEAHVLMLNKEGDELFPARNVRLLFDSVAARSKQLLFWPGTHDDWGPNMIAASVTFLNEHFGPSRHAT